MAASNPKRLIGWSVTSAASLGCVAKIEERSGLRSNLAIFWQIPAGLAHQPDWWWLCEPCPPEPPGTSVPLGFGGWLFRAGSSHQKISPLRISVIFMGGCNAGKVQVLPRPSPGCGMRPALEANGRVDEKSRLHRFRPLLFSLALAFPAMNNMGTICEDLGGRRSRMRNQGLSFHALQTCAHFFNWRGGLNDGRWRPGGRRRRRGASIR